MRNSRFSIASSGAHSMRVARAEAQVGAERVAHRVDEALGAARREAVLPPEAEHLHAAAGAVEARLDPADEAVAEEHRQHVPTPAPLGRRDEELPDVLELEQGSEQSPVPDQRIERRQECDGGRRLRRVLEQVDLRSEHEPLAAHVLDVNRNELAGRRRAPRAVPFFPDTPATSDRAWRGRCRRRCHPRHPRRGGRERGSARGACGGVAPSAGSRARAASAGSSRSTTS